MGGKSFNIRKNVSYSIAAFVINAALVYSTYKLILFQGGLKLLGVWSVIGAWTAFIRLGDPGLAQALIRSLAVAPAGDAELARSAYVKNHISTAILASGSVSAFFSTVGCFVLLQFMPAILGEQHFNDAELVVPILCASLVVASVNLVFTAALQGLHMGFIASKITVLGSLVLLFASLPLTHTYGLIGLASAQLIQQCANFALFWRAINCFEEGCLSGLFSGWDFQTLKKMMRVGVGVQAVNIGNSAFEPFSKLLVGRLSGLEVQGLFEIAYKTISIPRNAIAAGASATIPTLAAMSKSGNSEQARNLFRATTTKMFAASIFFGVSMSLASPILSKLWTGHNDPALTKYLIWLAIAFSVNSAAAIYYNIGLAAGKMFGNIVAVYASISTLMIPYWFNVQGSPDYPVAAACLALVVGGVITYLLNSRILKREATT